MEDYKTINNELKLYAQDLSMRPQIVVANKCEMPDIQDGLKRLQKQVDDDVKEAKGSEKEGLLNKKVYEISAVTGLGVDELNIAIASKVEEIKKQRIAEQGEVENYDKV